MLFRLIAVLLLVLTGADRAMAAAASGWSDTEHVKVRLVSASNATGTDKTLKLGLHFKMEGTWKVYWRTPGDAGFPPTLDWTGSNNLAKATIHWPAPERFSLLGITTAGYKHEVLFPLTIDLEKTGKAFDGKVVADFLACDEICIPVNTTLDLNLPEGKASPSDFAHLINQYQTRVPGDGRRSGLTLEKATFYPDAKDKGAGTLRLSLKALAPIVAPDAFIEGPALLEFRDPAVSLDGTKAFLDVPVFGLNDFKGDLVGASIIATVVDGDRSLENSITVTAGNGPLNTAEAGTAPSILLIIGLALLGGLILNLMPCVLPVLSIKLLGVIEHGGSEDKAHVRLGFIATSAGILVTFLLMAAGLIALKAAGQAIGWGIQFQYPVFLIALTVIVTLFACNLWGFYEFRLPAFLSGLGGNDGGEKGFRRHFLTGIFATLLATPCSAPFLGTAVGFALSRGPVEILTIFASLGIGLALPYIAIALFPGLATSLPKPGLWMIRLKQILGFALAATAGWLISVLVAQTGLEIAVFIACVMVVLTLVIWQIHKRPRLAGHGKLIALCLVGLAFLPTAVDISTTAAKQDTSQTSINWQPFDEAAIAAHVAQGKTVLVDVTADWCITCQVNKKLVLETGPVLETLNDDRVVALKADWTKPNDTIAAYLAKHGRYGIPFNIVYGPKAPDGIILSELLSEQDTLDALIKASGDDTLAQR